MIIYHKSPIYKERVIDKSPMTLLIILEYTCVNLACEMKEDLYECILGKVFIS